MVETTFCVSGAALALAGDGINEDLLNAIDTKQIIQVNGDYIVDQWITEAESFINITTRNNWIDSFSSLNTDASRILSKTAAELAAVKCIEYDMGGYTNLAEATAMINVLRDLALRSLSLLRDKKVEDFIDAA